MLHLSDLLSRGYFPKELPPPFKTTEFADAVSDPFLRVPAEFESNPKGRKRDSAWCNHNLVRTGGLRRHLGIPNPVHFYRLAQLIVRNWRHLREHANASPYSLSKPVASSTRAISPEHDLSERATQRVAMRTGARVLVTADISRFFPSIYTHSIPWAILGKGAAKSAHANNTLSGQWPDDIDIFSRSLNRSQTIGIPIGPDTSRLIAEVILSAIDQEIAKAKPRVRGIRFIDDYEFAAETRSDAEAILNALQVQLAHYELALNGAKTHILELPALLEAPWTSGLRCFPFRTSGSTAQKYDLIGYFDAVFDLFKRFPDEGLMKYAIGRLRTVEVESDNWALLQNILGQCILVEPACIPQVCDQMVYYQAQCYEPLKQLWTQTLNQVICQHLPIGHASEAGWAMWLMKNLGC